MEENNWPYDVPDVCDLCGKQAWFSRMVIYYIDGVPQLLCPDCVKEREQRQ